MELTTSFFSSIFNLIPTFSMYILLVFLSFLLYAGPKRARLLLTTFKRDIAYHIMTKIRIHRIRKSVAINTLLRDHLYRNVGKHPNKVALIDADTKKYLTYKQLQDLCHKVANLFKEAGYKKGDVVGILMENRIEYLPICHGLTMIGAIPALLNTNIRGESLKHCIKVCDCKSIIFTGYMQEVIKEIENDLSIDMYCYDPQSDAPPSWKPFAELLDASPVTPPPRSPDIKCTDILLYLFTSGTTGLPKAAVYSGLRAVATNNADWLNESDTLYCALPLYHLNPVVFVNMCLSKGGTMVVKRKFSARAFIEDCCKYKVTVFNYIGEVCRYVLAQPPSVFDKMHSIRAAVGNGLRASIWCEFQERFNIGKIVEFYGATEGIHVLMNTVGRPGAIGFNPLLFPNRDFKLIRIDEGTGEIVRDPKGLAIEADINEPGHAVVRITKTRRFHGYTNKDATTKKIGHDIFELGDSAFLTGDILIKDEEGFYYFQDRTGDTFRWKGENVSTSEVEGIVSKIAQLNDVCVYGVSVPGTEGKAGMAAIAHSAPNNNSSNSNNNNNNNNNNSNNNKINVEDLRVGMEKCLPKYAVPQFLRFGASLEVTGTFKMKKNGLRKEGYDPDVMGETDELYYFDKLQGKYMRLDADAYRKIQSREIIF